MYTTVLLPQAGKRQQQALKAADACSSTPSRLSNNSTGSSARRGATPYPIGPPPTGAEATHGVSPDNRLHRAHSLASSHNGSPRASPVNKLPRRIHSSAASPVNMLPRRTHSPQFRRTPAQCRTTSCPEWTHSPAATQDHSAYHHRLTTMAPRRQ